LINEDVERGFALPLPLDIIHHLPNASLAPLGCQEQETIDEHGNRVPKFRMTHDQSFPGPSGFSVNNRVQKELLPPILYSYVLLRSIHYIINLRSTYPNTKIFLCKVDIDAAFRRCHISHHTAYECLTTYDNLLFMALRLTFGGAPCPAIWGYISETIADLANTLIQNQHWDHHHLFDPLSEQVDHPISLPDTIPFHAAKPTSVFIPPNPLGKIDIYIDDTIGIAPDILDNVNRTSKSIPLAIHSIARPLDSSDIIPRKDIISLKKFSAEGRMEETKTILGWIINTRSLTISLPPDKHNRWTSDIKNILSSNKVRHKTLETLLGRLNHIATIYSPMRHFLGWIYQALFCASHSGWTFLKSNE
jgi:hypothetical protein